MRISAAREREHIAACTGYCITIDIRCAYKPGRIAGSRIQLCSRGICSKCNCTGRPVRAPGASDISAYLYRIRLTIQKARNPGQRHVRIVVSFHTRMNLSGNSIRHDVLVIACIADRRMIQPIVHHEIRRAAISGAQYRTATIIYRDGNCCSTGATACIRSCHRICCCNGWRNNLRSAAE